MDYPIIESVGIVVLDEEKVLLVSHGKASNYKVGVLGIPSGKIEKGESKKEAAKRELEEESGLKCKTNELISLPKSYRAKIKQNDGVKIFNWYVFLCKKFKGELRDTDETKPFWTSAKSLNLYKLLPNVKKAVRLAQTL